MRAPVARPRIEWERWLGVRGAAVLGGIFLAIAGILFFQYSIEHGYITKEMRIVLGVLAGVGCLVGGEAVRRRSYVLTGHAITGAGGVILYAAFWSAYTLGIFAFGVSFALMAVVTALCGFLAWRNRSQVIAWLGLSGGFATPLLLATDRDNPVGLFGYLLLLDISFLFVANKRRWPLLGAFGLFGTALIQLLWVANRMRPETFAIALVVLGVFALLFVAFAPKAPDKDSTVRLLTQAGGLLLPFAFAAYFAGRVDVGYHLYPLLLLASLLAVAASWMARKQDAIFAPAGAAVGGTAIAFVWVVSNRLEPERVWELVVCAAIFVAVFHAASEWRRAEAGAARQAHDAGSLGAALGMIGVLFAASVQPHGVEAWPFLVGFLVLPLASLRLDALAPNPAIPFLALFSSALALGMRLREHALRSEAPEGLALLLACLAIPLVALGAGWVRRASPGTRWRFAVASLVGLPFLPALSIDAPDDAARAALPLLQLLVLGALMTIGAAGARSSALFALAALTTAIGQSASHALDATTAEGELTLAFAVLALSSAFFAVAPLLRRSAWSGSRGIAWIGPLAVALGYPVAAQAWAARSGDAALGIPPLVWAAILLAAAAWALAGRRTERSGTTVAGLHGFVVAAFFLGLALPVQIDRPVFPLAASAAALAAAIVWRRTDQLSLKYVAGALAAAVGLYALFDGPTSLYAVEAVPIWNGHAFDVLLPGILLLAASMLVLPLEAPRLRDRETALYPTRKPVIAALTGLCGLLVVFLWINVEVQNHFAQSAPFRLEFGDDSARDLSLSIAWAIYAIALLFVGMARKSGLLRWVSLILLLGTIGKLFLVDLTDLRGLYRVGSFLGLALSLLAVSWIYQRFVFRKAPEAAT